MILNVAWGDCWCCVDVHHNRCLKNIFSFEYSHLPFWSSLHNSPNPASQKADLHTASGPPQLFTQDHSLPES